MPVSPGGRLGPYERVSFLGAGGMGDVRDVGTEKGTGYVVLRCS
jgi:hypothetical protein